MKLNLNTFTVSMLGSFARSVITISEKPEYAIVQDHPLLRTLNGTYNKYFAVYERQSYSGLGKTVHGLELGRDEPFKAIRSSAKAIMRINGFPTQEDAKDIYAVIDQLGSKMDLLDYASENEKMNKLIEIFDLPEYTTKLANLNLTDVYALLKTRNKAFEDLYYQQTQANANLRQQESASSLRDDLSSKIKSYLYFVTSMKDVPGWIGLYSELSEAYKAVKGAAAKPAAKPEDAPANEGTEPAAN